MRFDSGLLQQIGNPQQPRFTTPLESAQARLSAINGVQQVQAGQLELQQKQQQMAVAQQAHDVIAKHQGDLKAALPELGGILPPELFQHYQKAVADSDAAARDQQTADKQRFDLINGNQDASEVTVPPAPYMETPEALQPSPVETRQVELPLPKMNVGGLELQPESRRQRMAREFEKFKQEKLLESQLREPKNIDPNSPAGIAAAIQRAREESTIPQRPTAPVPGRDIPFSPAVEEQRMAERKAARNIADLPPTVATRVGQIADKFDSSPVVKNYNESINRHETVRGILNGKLGGPGDLAAVFEFMKGLDPTSVVRESEYDTAAKSGNIFAGALAKFNGYLKPEGGFLPDRLKGDFLKVLEQKIAATKKQYDQQRGEAARQINKWTNREDGEDYLKDFTLPPESASGFTVTDPLGGTHQFPTKAAADAFKKAARIP